MNQTKLTRIKSALRESIEIASKATEGPWTPDGISVWSGEIHVCYTSQSDEDSEFLAHARTMTPIACKALLMAIEGLEQTLIGIGNTDDRMSDENSFIVNSIGDLVENTLTSITSEWPDV